MIQFPWFSLKKHDEFANNLAIEFIQHCPPDLVYKPKNRKANNKLNKAINNLYTLAHAYRNNVKLNIYTKARIGNKFMWSLKEAGYDDALIEELTNGILLALSGKE